MNLTNVTESEDRLRSIFSWNTRLGIAPKFGSRPIHWYQMDQFEAIGAIERAARKAGVSLMDVRSIKGTLTGVSVEKGKRVPFARVSLGKVVEL